MNVKPNHFFRSAGQALIATFIACILCHAYVAAAADAKKADNKVAVVNNVVIPESDLNLELQQVKKRMEQQGQTIPEERISDIKKKIVERLIDQELLYQESRNQGIKIDQSRVDDALSSIKDGFPDKDAFNKTLTESGLNESELKEKIEKGLAIKDLVEKAVADKIVIKDDAIKSFYDTNPSYFKVPEQVHASHILIKVPEGANAEQKATAKKKLTDIKKKIIDDGASFEEMAKQHSEGPSSTSGGDLGLFGRGQMVKPFEDAAFELNIGQLSDIVETRFGYHLIKVSEKKEAATIPMDEAKDKIQNFLKQQKMQQAISDYIATLKEKAEIKEYL